MPRIQHRPERRRPWQIRYRDPSGRDRARGVLRRSDAHRFANSVEGDRLLCEWTDPRLSKTTVAEWSERWRLTKSHPKPKTLASCESISALTYSRRLESTSFAIWTAWRDHGPTTCVRGSDVA